MKILVSGSLAYDRIMNFPGIFSDHVLPDKIHSLNVSFLVEDLNESFGGNAGNIAYNLALLGETPAPVARAGKDFAQYEKWLESVGVDTNLIEKDTELQTAFASILTDSKDNQITAFFPGAMKKPYTVTDATWSDAGIGIVSPGNPDDMRAFPKLFRERHIPYLYDPGQQIPALSGDDLKSGIEKSGALVSNDYELAMIVKKTGWNENILLDHTDMLVTTLGEQGSRIRTKIKTIEIPPAHPVSSLDPTGAGDAYRAGLLYGFLREWPLEVAGRFAGVVACYTVETHGTQTHRFTFDEVRLRYEENFKQQLPSHS